MLRPQTVQPHKTDMRSSAECETQAPSPAPLGLAQFDRDLAARREEGLRGEPASSPSPSSLHPHPLPSITALPLPSAFTLALTHARPPRTQSGARTGPAHALHMHGTYVAHTLHTHYTCTALHMHMCMHMDMCMHMCMYCINRPPFAIMASNANGPPLSSERRTSAVYQPMVRLPTSDTSPLEEHAEGSKGPHMNAHTMQRSRDTLTTYTPCICHAYNLPPLTFSAICRPLLEEQSPPEGLGGFLAVLKGAGGLDQLAKRAC